MVIYNRRMPIKRGVRMKKFICLIGLVFLFNSSVAFADKDAYFKLSGSLSLMQDSDIELNGAEIGNVETDTGFGVSAAAGKNYGNGFLEAEYSYRKVDADKAKRGGTTVDLSETSVYSSYKNIMVNAGYEFGKTTKPYFLAGIGMGWMSEMDGAEFAYQVGAGVTQPVNTNLGLFVGYKYLGSSDFDSDDNKDLSASYDSHNFEAGIKYSF